MRPAATLLFFYPPGTSWSCEPACFCASEDSVGVQGKQGAKTMHERHVSRAEKQNLQLTFILNNRGAARSGQENLSLGVLPSRTAPAGLGGRKVAICCHYNIFCQSLVYASHHHNVLSCCSVLQPAADSTRHCVGDLLRPGSPRFDLESATLLQFIT